MPGDLVDGWESVFRTTTDYEANIVRDRLLDGGVNAVILRHRDHSFNLTVGDMATIRVLVAPEELARARDILTAVPLSEAELTAAALAADPIAGEDRPDDGSLDSDERDEHADRKAEQTDRSNLDTRE